MARLSYEVFLVLSSFLNVKRNMYKSQFRLKRIDRKLTFYLNDEILKWNFIFEGTSKKMFSCFSSMSDCDKNYLQIRLNSIFFWRYF